MVPTGVGTPLCSGTLVYDVNDTPLKSLILAREVYGPNGCRYSSLVRYFSV